MLYHKAISSNQAEILYEKTCMYNAKKYINDKFHFRVIKVDFAAFEFVYFEGVYFFLHQTLIRFK